MKPAVRTPVALGPGGPLWRRRSLIIGVFKTLIKAKGPKDGPVESPYLAADSMGLATGEPSTASR